MDFADTPAEANFRAEARAWLLEHAHARAGHPNDLKAHVPFDHEDNEEECNWVSACREWQRTKYEAGYAAIAWPTSAGGRGGTPMEEVIFAQEEARFNVPSGAFAITLGMVAPTILRHGTDQQKTHLPRMLSGKELWCQLFSEPAAGSDLASLQTRALRDGEEWVVRGQKVWTSLAHHADWGYLLCRTDSSVPKHRGLTAFLLPMNIPGITIRPLRQMTGGASFNEVFLDDVRVSDRHRLGACGAGWHVAVTTLMNERSSYTGKAPGQAAFDAIVTVARSCGRDSDPIVRDRLAQLYVLMEVNRYSSYRILTAISKGTVPGPEGSVAKLAVARILRIMSNLAVDVDGPAGVVEGPAASLLVGAPGLRLAGGTDEILRNIVAERVLGLPREMRVDDLSFDHASAVAGPEPG